jgi:cytochrome c peroxidase
MRLFCGEAGCSRCHSGKFQTDHQFHAIAMPQIRPGKGDGANGSYWRATGHKSFLEDFGRGRVTVRPEDNYRFRTPSLRNVFLAGPRGHDGAYGSLEEVVRHLSRRSGGSRATFCPRAVSPLDSVLELTMTGSNLRHDWMNERCLEGFLRRDGWVREGPP